MPTRSFLGFSFIIFALLFAACGSLDRPSRSQETATALVAPPTETIAESPTSAPSPSALPPSATPPPQPSAPPSPTASPSPAPTAGPTQSPLDRLVAARDIENGKLLFETFQDAANYSCANCHSPSSEKSLLGPGLLNIKDRALTRVAGQGAAEYLYKSITEPKTYVVEGFDAELMPANWTEIYSELEIFDIVAYLMTLAGESDLDGPEAASDAAEVWIYGEIALPAAASAARGAELFQAMQPAAGYACATCHFSDTEARLIGPGLLNIGRRAETRVAGQSGVEYLFTSIVNPGDFIAPDFPENLEPRNYSQVFSEAEIYDIIAYLLTLK